MLDFNFNLFPVLETKRLKLRRIIMGDAELILEIRTAIDAIKYLNLPFFTRTMEQVKESIIKIESGIQSNDLIAWGITLKDDDNIIGTVSYHKVDKVHGFAEIGYILSPSHWEKGIVSEATEAVLDYGFNTMNLHRIEAYVSPENYPSIRLLEKFNFMKEGLMRENYYMNGHYTDSVIYALLKSDYSAFLNSIKFKRL